MPSRRLYTKLQPYKYFEDLFLKDYHIALLVSGDEVMQILDLKDKSHELVKDSIFIWKL